MGNYWIEKERDEERYRAETNDLWDQATHSNIARLHKAQVDAFQFDIALSERQIELIHMFDAGIPEKQIKAIIKWDNRYGKLLDRTNRNRSESKTEF